MRALFPRQMTAKRPMKLSTTVTLMVSSVLISVLIVVYALWLVQISHVTREGVKDTAFAVARTLADSREVREGLALPPRQNPIAGLAEQVRKRNDLLFAVVTNMDGIRYSHPDPQIIGQHFVGNDLHPALEGREFFAINHGVLAPALRVFTPVWDSQRRQIGVVVVGISLSKVDQQVNRSRWGVVWTVLFSVLMGFLGIWGLVRVLKKIMFGLEPYEISSRFEQRQAMLQSLKEGVIAVDSQGRVTLINHAARQMLLSPGPGGESQHAPLLTGLREVLESGSAILDREIGCNGRLLLCNTVPIRSQKRLIGAVSTFRDKTEISLLMQRLDGMVNYVDALRQHTHEFMNKLHVILGLAQIKQFDKLESYILQTAQHYQADIGDIQHKIKSPVIAGFMLGKINRAKELGHTLVLAPESQVPDNSDERQVTVLITLLGNLIENALDAMGTTPEGEIGVLLHYQQGTLSVEVSDDGPGIPPQIVAQIFTKGFSTKGDNRGVGLFLVKQQTEQLGGSVSVESEPGVFTQFFAQIPWGSERNHA